jgi:large subunit ribosomal protein L19
MEREFVRPQALCYNRQSCLQDERNFQMDLVSSINKPHPNAKDLPEPRPGDRVRVHLRIIEGERERVQVFQGVVMRKRKGGPNLNFTVRRIGAHGVGVERTFFMNSPRLEKIEIVSHAHVRRAQLYYLRNLRGKKARLREKRMDATPAAPESTSEE